MENPKVDLELPKILILSVLAGLTVPLWGWFVPLVFLLVEEEQSTKEPENRERLKNLSFQS